MPITNFQPEIWSANLLVAYETATVFASPVVVNRDYEGDIAQAGDTVRITALNDPTIITYTKNTDMVLETLTDTQQSLLIDRARAFNFDVDDIDTRQAAGSIIPEATRKAGYRLSLDADLYVAGLHVDIAAGNVVTPASIAGAPADPVAEARKVLDQVISRLNVRLDESNVPRQGRYVILPPWLLSRLMADPALIQAAAASAGNSSAIFENGWAGTTYDGTRILVSNNVVSAVGPPNTFTIMAGTNDAITMAEQINTVEAYRPERRFTDAVKGLFLYGAKVIRPTGLAKIVVTRT